MSWPAAALLAVCLCLFSPLVVSNEAPLSREGELILELQLEGRSLGLDVLGYQRDQAFLVSMAELMDGLQLPINVDPAAGRAGGWFIQEERAFDLDLEAGRVESDGEVFSIATGSVVLFEGDLFVTTAALEQWLPLELEPILRELVLNVEPTEVLPLQSRMAREARRPSSVLRPQREPQLPLQETPYRMLGPHTTDIRLDYSNVRQDEDSSVRHAGRYSLLSRGDLGWMTSTISLSGRDEDTLTGGRFKLERSAVDGPLNLNHFEVGDVAPRQAGSSNRGVLVRGGAARGGLDGRFADESIDLRGDILPGWEVELYRNGILIDVQTVGEDGQYEFLEVPLEFGENQFEFIFYGPFGEERRDEVTHFVGPDMLGVGAINYELAATQAQRSVFDVNPPTGRGDRDTGQYAANFNMGLNRNLIGRLGVESFERDEERIEYYSAGLSAAFARFQASTSYDFRPDDLDRINTSARSRIGDTRFNFGYTHFTTVRLAVEDTPDNRTRWRSSLGLSSRPFGLPLSLSANHTHRIESTSSRAALGTSVRGGRRGRFSKTFNYSREDRRAQGAQLEQRTSGSISFATTLRPWRLRLGTNYDIAPETKLRLLTASARLRVDRSMTMNFDVRHNRESRFTTYRAGFNWLLDSVQVSPRVSYDSNHRWAGLISLSTSVVPRPGRWLPEFERLPHANTGSAQARVFLDREGDGEFGPQDEPLSDVRIDAPQSFRRAETGPDGQAYVTRLRRHRQTDIAIDPSTLPDFELDPVDGGRSVIPRPGSWSVVDFPVIRTMELEGHVYELVEGDRRPLRRVVVELADEKGEAISRQRTAFDGFFLFTSVPPGDYELRIDGEAAERVLESPEAISVSSDGGVKTGLDFLLRSAPGRSFLHSERTEVPAQETASGASEGWGVQLGAFSQRANAEARWRNVSETHPEHLSRLMPVYSESGGWIRLLVGSFDNEADARQLCERLGAQGLDCLVRRLTQ